MATNEDINIRVHSEGGERAIGITPEQTERGIGINNESIVVRSVKSYNDLDDKPQINSVELEGDKTASDLGFADVAMSGSYNDLTDTPEIPAAQVNSDWNANSGVAEILNKPTIPTKTSQLDNDSGFLTSESDPVFSASAAATITSQDITDWNDKSDFSGSYDDLTNKPTIPTKTSQLANDGSDGTSTYVEADQLAAVATSGAYSDLSGTPSLATVATTGDYDDLTNKPTIPTVNNATLTIQKNGTTVNTFTANASSNVTADISVPTKTSDLTNDGSDNTAQYLETDETAYRGASIPFGIVDNTSTSTVFTATVPGITELRDGVCMWLKNGTVTSASGFTINVNNLGAKPVYSNMSAASAEGTLFNVNYTFMFVYDSSRVAGGCWVLNRGYFSDANSVGYQIRTNSSTLPALQTGYRYRLWLTSADGQHYVPINTATGTSTTSTKALNTTTPIDPFGTIVYNATNGTVNADANLPTGTQWTQFTLDLRYAKYPLTTLTFPDPVYLQCTPQSTGGALINDIVQTLPTTEDGKIYIYLGNAYSTVSMELKQNHPVYYFKDGAIRLWSGETVPTLYTTTGQNTDGAVTQKLFTDTVGNVETILQTLNNGGGAQ